MCNVHPNCHACSFSYGTYREIWSKKLDKAINILSIDKNKSITLHPNDQWHYRKKSLLHVDSTIIPPKIGLIQNNDVININNCPLHSQSINELIEITKYSLPHFDKFPLKYILFNDMAIVLVIKDHYNKLPKYIELTKDIFTERDFPNLFLHLNPATGNKVFLKSYLYPIYGETFLRNDLGYWYHPLAFQQQISSIHIESLQIAIDYLKNNENLLDIYCGIGIMSANSERYFNRIIGVEQSPVSIECAKKNSFNTNLYTGNVETIINHIILGNSTFFNNYSLYVNPPRSGIGEQLIEKILKKPPKQIAYLSCNPKSLNKDLNCLKNHYLINHIHFFDFLPYTNNIEALVLMGLK
ncbi:MAG: rRNA (uracil1939-C5)-methyltransferase [Rikenellaceae bacterium]|nr:rRNA (uracil1939-C5)-methyltransferase [Rikenellaceae bacterium]MDN5356210.1 rRNA (uracil1939-C5)-methyltransferase [Rikenellaceae bacterium]